MRMIVDMKTGEITEGEDLFVEAVGFDEVFEETVTLEELADRVLSLEEIVGGN